MFCTVILTNAVLEDAFAGTVNWDQKVFHWQDSGPSLRDVTEDADCYESLP